MLIIVCVIGLDAFSLIDFCFNPYLGTSQSAPECTLMFVSHPFSFPETMKQKKKLKDKKPSRAFLYF
jgi:hypothetical protein